MSLAAPTVERPELAAEPSLPNKSISINDSNSTDTTLQPSGHSPEAVIDKKPYFISIDNIDDYPNYENYVQTLAKLKYPSLGLVLDFLQSSGESSCSLRVDSCVLCRYFGLHIIALFKDGTCKDLCVLDRHTHQPSDVCLNKMINDVTELGQNSQSNGLLRFVLLVEDIKPQGMKLLGTFLNIDPRVFERLLNIKREYTNGLAGVHVLDYCQGYIYRDSLGAKVFSNFQDGTLETLKLNGKLRRWWRDIVGHEQRVVVAAVPKTNFIPVPADVVFFSSLPQKASLKFMPSATIGSKNAFTLQSFDSLKDFPSFFQFQTDFSDVLHQISKGTSDNMAAIKFATYEALNDKEMPAHLKTLSGATTFIAAKWTSLVNQIQEVISETDVPDATSLPLLRIMIKRKHMFSEVKRTLTTLHESITAPELSTVKGSLTSVGNKLDDWIRDLESTISLCSNYLSLDESQRAITRSTRTNQLTVLAFVFIPISAVASGFGMNVNVLTNNPPIYWFAGVGAGVALITFLYAMYFQQLNKGVGLISFYLLSLALDIIIIILKFTALPFWWILITLGSPLLLLLYFLFGEKPINAWPGYLLTIVESAWFLLAMYWNHSAKILQWSPPFLDIRLEWRAGKKLPKVPELDGDLELTPRKERDTGSCVVM